MEMRKPPFDDYERRPSMAETIAFALVSSVCNAPITLSCVLVEPRWRIHVLTSSIAARMAIRLRWSSSSASAVVVALSRSGSVGVIA